MSSPQLGFRYGIDSTKIGQKERLPAKVLEDYSMSETEQTDESDVEDILPWSRQSQTPAPYPASAQTQDSTQPLARQIGQQPFRAELDVPKNRTHNGRFNLIRPIKDEQGHEQDHQELQSCKLEDDKMSVSETGRPELRTRSRACKRSISTPTTKHEGTRACKVIKGRVKSNKNTNELSQTKTAVDFRMRKDIEKEYGDRLAELLDDDIVKRVDDEGGITPRGRLFKAAVQMIERAREERNAKSNNMRRADSNPFASDIELIRRNAMHVQQSLENLEHSMQPLIRSD